MEKKFNWFSISDYILILDRSPIINGFNTLISLPNIIIKWCLYIRSNNNNNNKRSMNGLLWDHLSLEVSPPPDISAMYYGVGGGMIKKIQ